ncbi:hypothetical protein FB451DRAFT_1228069 [Mycena latifolia]|nr:hypothetical protein FB451DRAFT_1228069 [Mycena latifolia]
MLALGFFLMEAIGTKHFTLPISSGHSGTHGPSNAPCIANLQVFSILAGELMILIRINAVYGWSRKVVALTLFLFSVQIGLVTTVVSIRGGSSALMGSTGILTCTTNQANVPDINIASIYLGLIIQKATDVSQVIEAADGQQRVRKMPFFAAFRSTRMTPTLHVCLRDAALYFVLILGVLVLNLVLILEHNPYAQLGTPLMLNFTSFQSTRIFLNLKDISLARDLYTGATWSEFQRTSALEFHVPSGQLASGDRSAWRPEAPVSPPRRREDWEHIGPEMYSSRRPNAL